MNIKQWTIERKAKARELFSAYPSGDVFLTGNEAPYVVMEVPCDVAAGLLIADTHHISTAQEVTAHHKAGQQFAAREVDRAWRNNELAGVLTSMTRRAK